MKKPNDIFLVGNVALEDEDLRSVFTKFSGFTKFISTSRNNGDVPVCIGKGDGRRTSYAYTKDHSECEDRLVVRWLTGGGPSYNRHFGRHARASGWMS